MEKYQLYRTALDALHFLLSSELGFDDKSLKFLVGLFQYVSDEIKDEINVIVTKVSVIEN